MVSTKQFKNRLPRVAGSLIFTSVAAPKPVKVPPCRKSNFMLWILSQKFVNELSLLLAVSAASLIASTRSCLLVIWAPRRFMKIEWNMLVPFGKVLSSTCLARAVFPVEGGPIKIVNNGGPRSFSVNNRASSSRLKNSNILIRERPEYERTRRQRGHAEKLAC